ncbi:MAG: acyl-CoA dehydrogenase family protein [Pseudomonadota bacterium]
MAPHAPRTRLQTHDVANQPPPFLNVNRYETDIALKSAVEANGGAPHRAHLSAFGGKVGSDEVQTHADLANKNPPQLKSFDRYGQRLDEATFHPSYHALMGLGLGAGISSIAWTADTGGHVAHSALMYLMAQADGGVCCPFSMTYAVVPALRRNAALTAQWAPRLLSASYDKRFIPAAEKTGVTMGMAMTEKQGGSDVRANTTKAEHLEGETYALTGHKWFCSAPMSDAFLTLAYAEGGLTCFFVPRWRPDGTRNAIHIMRLKDKLGDKSNASSEIEYHGAHAVRVGDEGRGVATIIDMVQGTRLDCLVGSAAGMRAALAEAMWHAAHRTAFQKKLIDQPAMAAVLADLTLEAEAATALAFRIAQAFDRAGTDETEAAFMRLATPVAKYWICKRTPGFSYEAMECLGGAGYVEESPMPRLYRAAPLNAIWEGSGNVIALDVLRAIARAPETLEAVLAEIESARGAHPNLDAAIDAVKADALAGAVSEAGARRFVERLAIALQAAVLFKTAPGSVADGFAAARLSEDRSLVYGAVSGLDFDALLHRATPLQ